MKRNRNRNRAIVGHFVEVCRRNGLKVIRCKNKAMILNREEKLECKILVDTMQLEPVSEFKYLECVLEESDTDEAVS